MTDNCPNCHQRHVEPAAEYRGDVEVSHLYRCPACGETASSRGTGPESGRGRETAAPPSRARTGPLAAEQAPGVRESHRVGERQGGAQRADPTPEPIPGQTALPLHPMQPTLWSL
ncbi:hypothetical protein GA0115253_100456 [Streptomyces sp. Termitarium-T10T-6]|nr:hypothetical protein GA0115253_100456 [Streptomyces sp. Termitarium-T10T-6]